jgi:hypothetical protein
MSSLCLIDLAAAEVNGIFGFRVFASYMRGRLLSCESRLNRA